MTVETRLDDLRVHPWKRDDIGLYRDDIGRPATREDILSVAREMGQELEWCLNHDRQAIDGECGVYLDGATNVCRVVEATLLMEEE